MDEVVIVVKILRSKTKRFDYAVCSVEESNNLEMLTIDELQSSLLVHEQRMNGHVQEEQALKITHDERLGGRGRPLNKAIIECFKCHKLGHFQYECPNWEKCANYAKIDEEEEMLLMSYVESDNSKREAVWFIALGCSNHMCGNK